MRIVSYVSFDPTGIIIISYYIYIEMWLAVKIIKAILMRESFYVTSTLI